jgi:hypothetical protein
LITSIVYGLCFAILLLGVNKNIKIMAGLCLAYLVSENLVYWYFLTHNWMFDFNLYLTICWALDSALLFGVGCVLSGTRQKLMAALALPLMLVQVFAIQYPMLFPEYVFTFAARSGHMYFIEAFIFCSALKDNTVKEWLSTSSILFFVIVAHML